ncbi:SLC13 family permease [Natronogracilivirga saccharolytica]|uniref:SLC13/DASS family transporter n=1 Tax=Natronogracilivirga saccharolytica TaxID=2812953 RepID=A0A8J7UVJ3_9BACT|nr:SLC13 family permease [Natronogracilivirga saccharolytica]MBP3192617.1 SLC13/DASS family transporter [Natronogracilivirga saccharolytica]
MPESLEYKSIWTILVISALLVLLLQGRYRTEHLFLSALLALLVPGVIKPSDAMAGFTHTVVITVGALFAVAAGVRKSGLLSSLEDILMREKSGIGGMLFRIMTTTSFFSSFLNNTPVVAILTPQLKDWAEKRGISVSKLLIPLSYAAITGGMITLVGTSTNLIVSGMLLERGAAPFHFFQLVWIALPATLLIILWFAVIGHRFLPDRPAPAAAWPAGASAPSGVYAGRNAAQTFEPGVSTHWPSGVYVMGGFTASHHTFSPRETARLPPPEDDVKVKSSPAKARLTALILAMMIALPVSGILPAHISVLAAAAVMITTGILPLREVAGSVQFSVLVVIASALGIGAAIENTGLAEGIASSVIDVTSGYGFLFVLFSIYLMTNLLTELITNNAAAVLMVPIGISAAASLGIDPQAVGVIVAVAASASFLSPVGYQTNLMVMKPGGYRFTDYFKAGLPVSMILMAITLTTVTLLWM